MRSLTTRFFAGLIVVSVAALALGTWWVRHTVEQQFGRQLIVEETVENINGEQVVRETRREIPGGPIVSDEYRAQVDIDQLNRRLLIALSVVVLGAGLVSAIVARRVLGPVRELHRAVEQMATGGPGRVQVHGDDELADLGHAFNSMADAIEQQEQRKRDLTNDIAHELRTPLTDLRCHLEALQDGVVDVTPETLGTLHAEVSHLQRLVEDLGELARAEARQLPLQPEVVAVDDVFRQLQRKAAPRAAALGVDIRVRLSSPGVTVWFDRGRLVQVLGNLLDNALVYTPSGGWIELSARLDSSAPSDDAVTIDVRDTGPGIPPEFRARIFDRFYRVDASRSRTTGGVGLGLAITRQIVEAGGGHVSVSSPPDGGSVFSVTLPSRPSS